MADESSTAPKTEPAVAAELATLVERARRGDPTALPRLREILDQHPEVWQHMGNLSALAEQSWFAVLAADNPLGIESLKRTVAVMKADLTGDRPTRLERMLVDQVIATWLEFTYLQATSAGSDQESLAQSRMRLKRLESAQKRHGMAVNLLTTVRSLMPAAPAPPKTLRLFDPKSEVA
jgi:hypothetical protein